MSLFEFCSFNLFSFYKGGLLFQQQTDLKDSGKFMLVGVDAIAYVVSGYCEIILLIKILRMKISKSFFFLWAEKNINQFNLEG